VRPGCSPEAAEAFEDKFARGRDFWNTYTACPTAVPAGHDTVEDLAKLCTDKFSAVDNPYHPHYFLVLDQRTAADGTVIVAHQDQVAGLQTLRCTPDTVSVLISCLSIYHNSIPDIIGNDVPVADEETYMDTFIYDVPFDHSERHNNVRVPLEQFTRTPGPGEGFTTLRLDAQKVVSLDRGLPDTDVELVWFGEPLTTSILLLHGASMDTPVEDKHLVGAVRK